MLLSRIAFRLAAFAAAALILCLAWEARQNIRLRGAIRARSEVNAKTITALNQALRIQAKQVLLAEAHVARLQQQAKSAPTAGSRRSPIRTADAASDTIDRAKHLIQEGKLREALEVYVKCYRELEVAEPGSGEWQHVIWAMLSLARSYPPAREAVEMLRDTAMAEFRATPSRETLAFEIAILNDRLHENERTIAVYDSLPAGSIQRPTLARFAFKPLVDAGRYADALVGRPFGQMLGPIDAATHLWHHLSVEQQEGLRAQIAQSAALDIEVLTGIGKVDDARVLTKNLLAFDASEATRTLLAQHVARARAASK